MGDDLYKVYGYLTLFPIEIGFVTPIFAKEDKLFTETSLHNIINGFEELSEEYWRSVEQRPEPSEVAIAVGSNCCYAVKWKETVYYGDSRHIVKILEKVALQEELDDYTRGMALSFIKKYRAPENVQAVVGCEELLQPELLIKSFREGDNESLNRIFTCFYSSYYTDFNRYARSHLLRHDDLSLYEIDDIIAEAFTDGLYSFYEHIKNQGFVEGKAKLKTFFFRFFLYQVLNRIRKRRLKHTEEYDAVLLLQEDRIDNEVSGLIGDQAAELSKALAQLDERATKLIMYRKIYRMSSEEIASLMGISKKSVNNEVYKSFIKLKKILKNSTM